MRRIFLLMLAALLLLTACAAPDTGDRPTTTTTESQDQKPPASPLLVWGSTSYDPWADWKAAESPQLGKLYYRLMPSPAQQPAIDATTRYVMSFTYITADHNRYDLKDYLLSRKFEAHTYADSEETSYYTLFDLTEAEIQSITPESVQAYYQLDTAPAVVGIHRHNSSTPLSETAWYRADLLWGTMYQYDVFTYSSGTVKLADPLMKENFSNEARPLAIWCEVRTDRDKSCKDYFKSLGWEILDEAYCFDSTNHTNIPTDRALVAATIDQLLTVDIADVAAYYGCNPEDISVVFLHAMPRSLTSFEELKN